MYIYIYLHICICICILKYIYIYIYTHVCVYVYVDLYLYMHMYVCIYVCMHMYVYMYMYVYVSILIRRTMYTYLYLYGRTTRYSKYMYSYTEAVFRVWHRILLKVAGCFQKLHMRQSPSYVVFQNLASGKPYTLNHLQTRWDIKISHFWIKTFEQCSKSIYHSIESCLLENGIPGSWIMTIPNIWRFPETGVSLTNPCLWDSPYIWGTPIYGNLQKFRKRLKSLMITNHPSSFIDYIPTTSADFEWFWWLNSMDDG